MSTFKLNAVKDLAEANVSTIEQLANGRAKAWVSFNATGTIAIYGSHNVSGITDGGAGVFTVNIDEDMPDINYCVVISKGHITASGAAPINEHIHSNGSTVAPTVGAFSLYMTSAGVGNLDPVYVSATVFGTSV